MKPHNTIRKHHVIKTMQHTSLYNVYTSLISRFPMHFLTTPPRAWNTHRFQHATKPPTQTSTLTSISLWQYKIVLFFLHPNSVDRFTSKWSSSKWGYSCRLSHTLVCVCWKSEVDKFWSINNFHKFVQNIPQSSLFDNIFFNNPAVEK